MPSDFMKRGFAETARDAFDVATRLLADAHQPARALETAGQARARAFLDLLATRDLVWSKYSRERGEFMMDVPHARQ